MWQDNLNSKKEENKQIINKYNKEISNTRIVVSGIIRSSKRERSSGVTDNKKIEITENCCSFI